MEDASALNLRPLPLAIDKPNAGELVAVVGYPMGVLGMMAKAPTPVYARLAYRRDDQGAAVIVDPAFDGQAELLEQPLEADGAGARIGAEPEHENAAGADLPGHRQLAA